MSTVWVLEAFRYFDRNADGKLSTAELPGVRPTGVGDAAGNITEAELSARFDLLRNASDRWVACPAPLRPAEPDVVRAVNGAMGTVSAARSAEYAHSQAQQAYDDAVSAATTFEPSTAQVVGMISSGAVAVGTGAAALALGLASTAGIVLGVIAIVALLAMLIMFLTSSKTDESKIPQGLAEEAQTTRAASQAAQTNARQNWAHLLQTPEPPATALCRDQRI